MTCANLSQDLREPFATAVREQSKSASAGRGRGVWGVDS